MGYMSSNKKRVVLVGGGPACLSVIAQLHKRGLQDKVDITLVAQQDFYESNFGAPRFLVISSDDDMERYNRSSVSYATLFSEKGQTFQKDFKVQFKHGSCTGVDSDSIQTEQGDTIPFDFVILATGIDYPTMRPSGFTHFEERKAQVKAQADTYAQASGIIVMGGGSVGVEVVGELQEKYPEKRLYLISRNILPNSAKWAQDSFKKNLEARGVKIFLNDELVESDEATGVHKTKSGHTLEAEVIIKCFASKPNSNFLRGGPYENALDE